MGYTTQQHAAPCKLDTPCIYNPLAIQQNGSKISELPDGTAVARVCAAIVAQFGAQSLGKSSESF